MVADNLRIPGAPDYVKWMRCGPVVLRQPCKALPCRLATQRPQPHGTHTHACACVHLHAHLPPTSAAGSSHRCLMPCTRR